MDKVIIIKYSEIALKCGNRHLYENKLIENISKQTNIPLDLFEKRYGRIYIHKTDRFILKNLKRVFGIHSFVVAYKIPKDQSLLKEYALKIFEQCSDIQTFAIKTKRIDKTFPMRSNELNAFLGSAILEKNPKLKVDLTSADRKLYVEVRQEGIFIYRDDEEILGPGGLPVGTSGKSLLLLSGGIDSPVAGWMAMKRGIAIDAIYFDSFPFTGPKAKEKVLDLAQTLSQWKADKVKVFIPRFTEIQKTIAKKANEKYHTLLFRRSMRRIAEQIAEYFGYKALITGDNLGQVASQTVENLNVIDHNAKMLVMRPLLCFDKQQTIEIAKNIQTFSISSRPYEDCCTVFTPKKPSTKAKTFFVEETEKTLNLEPLEKQVVQSVIQDIEK